MPTKLLALLSLGLLAHRASSYQPLPPPPPPPSSAVVSPPSLPTPSSSASRSRASRALFPRSATPPATARDGLRGLVRRNAAASASSSLSVPFDPLDGGSTDLAQSTAALNPSSELTPLQSRLTKIGLTSFILSMCLALPLTLLPLLLLEKARILSRLRRERYSLRTGCFCARWLMRLIPFAKVKVVPSGEEGKGKEPEPSVWVCNHTSMLDVFVMLAVDKKLRGRNRRPIKIVYWKGLEKNPVTKILFTMSGFISVEMADNGSGNANEYNKSSFRPLLKSIKQAFAEGFDVGLLPEGQLNPTPELGLLPVFSGAFTLARMSKRQIRMMALYGVNHLWSADESVTSPTGRDITVRAYPPQRRKFGSGEEFGLVFKTVVGHFGATGRDVPNLDRWLDGSNWREMERRLEEEAEKDGEGGEE